MLTESCVMFFSPSRAVLSAILRDEYLTSAVRTIKEGEVSFFNADARIDTEYNVRNQTKHRRWPTMSIPKELGSLSSRQMASD